MSPNRGEILIEMELYVADDLLELAGSTEKYDVETRRIASLIAENIEKLHESYDFLWLVY